MTPKRSLIMLIDYKESSIGSINILRNSGVRQTNLNTAYILSFKFF
jgi:hypothetical protein